MATTPGVVGKVDQLHFFQACTSSNLGPTSVVPLTLILVRGTRRQEGDVGESGTQISVPTNSDSIDPTFVYTHDVTNYSLFSSFSFTMKTNEQ